MAAAARARSLCAEAADRPAKNGLRRADRRLAARPPARVGGIASGADPSKIVRIRSHRARASSLAGASRRQPQLAISVVDRVDAASVARAMDVIPRLQKIIYVTTDLRVGGAEAMLTRLATARPAVADGITVVSLLPAEAHVERLRAAGIAVIELNFKSASGIATGLFRIAQLIARGRPDVVQGWMYHGDLLALIALVLSGRRRRTCLIWSIRCSDMD